jgi:hypothetical protein
MLIKRGISSLLLRASACIISVSKIKKKQIPGNQEITTEVGKSIYLKGV